MVDATHGYAVKGVYPAYQLVGSADAGRTWNALTTVRPSGTATVAGRTILFGTQLGPSTFAVERSDDAGRTWRMSRPFRDSHRGSIGAPDLVDSQQLYVAIGEGAAAGSESESLWASSDGGRSWRFVSRTGFATTRPGQLPFGCDKNGYSFATTSRGWAGGFCPGGAPFLYRTDDGGHTWRRVPLPGLRACACDVYPPQLFGTRRGVMSVLGRGATGDKAVTLVYWTNDGGEHWRVSRPTTGLAPSASVPNANTALIAATAPGIIRTGPFDRLVRTADAGRTWRSVALPFDAGEYRIDAVSATTAFAYGPSVLETTDGGAHWLGLRAWPVCQLQEPNALHGTSSLLVARGASSMALCRYGGLGAKGAVGGLVASARVRGNAVGGLINELDVLPQAQGKISCPLDDGSNILATFTYPHEAPRIVRVGLRGCGTVTNGRVTRGATPRIVTRLTRFLQPSGPVRPCAATQLGVSVRTQGENTTAWIGTIVQNLGRVCVAKNVPVIVEVEHQRLMLHVSGTLDHGGTQLLVADWGNWCGSRVGVSVTAEVGAAEEVAPVRPLPVCLQRGQPSRLSAVH